MKRTAESQLTKDDFEAEQDAPATDEPENENGFARAPAEVIAKRRILKARRTHAPAQKSDTDTDNPFATLRKSNIEAAGDATPSVKDAQSEKPISVQTGDKNETRHENEAAIENTENNNKKPLEKAIDEKANNASNATKASNASNECNEKRDNKSSDAPEVGNTQASVNSCKQTGKVDKAIHEEAVPEAEEKKRAFSVTSKKGMNSDEKTAAVINENEAAAAATSVTNATTATDDVDDTDAAKASTVKECVKDEKKDDAKKSNEDICDAEEKSEAVSKDKTVSGESEIKSIVFGGASAANTISFAKAAKTDNAFDFKASSSAAPTQDASTYVFKEQHIPSGEEDEEEVMRIRSKLYILDGEGDKKKWKERGVGVVKLNVHKMSRRARLLMRSEGVLKVILNTCVYKEMKLDRATERSIRFHGFEEKQSMCYLLRFESRDTACEFVEAVEKWKKIDEK